MKSTALAALLLLSSSGLFAQETPAAQFAGTTQFAQALRSVDTTMLKSLYSSDPPAASIGKDKQPHEISEEINFWQDLRTSGLRDLQVLQRESGDQQGMHIVSLTLGFKVSTPEGERTRYVLEDQGWQKQGSDWKIVIAKHTDVVKFAQPMKLKANLYAPNVDAKAEIKEAVAKAKSEHKRVILVFGANWCYDCHVLDFDLHQPDIAKLADPNFVVAHIDIGDDGKMNNDLAKQYQVPLERGVPALAVLDGEGKLLYSQQHGEFEAARTMDPDNVVTFLNKWKP
jgi:thiol-disulfide isomerase/thioredoxin